jgi:hypothetical protein
MTSGSNCRHLNKPQNEDARRSILPAYHRMTAKLQHFPLETNRAHVPVDQDKMRTSFFGVIDVFLQIIYSPTIISTSAPSKMDFESKPA